MLDDGCRALIQDRSVAFKQLRIALPQPLGRELDGRQWVLDFVRDPSRHLAPRLHSLNLLNLRDVLQKDHDAQDVPLVVSQGGGGDHHRENSVRERYSHLALDTGTALDLVHDLAHRLKVIQLEDGQIIPPQNLRCLHAQHLLRGSVDGCDPSRRVHGEYPGGNICQQSLGIATSSLEL